MLLRTRHPNFSTGRRGFDVTATLLALLRHKSRRRRAPRPAAGSPTHAIAGTRARAVTMATVRPPSLLNHITPGGWQAAVRHDTVVSRRRRRHATAASSDFFCVPFGGRANGRVSTPPTPSATTAARRRVRRLHLRLRLRRLRPALPASSAHLRRDVQLGFRRRLRRRRPRLGFRPARADSMWDRTIVSCLMSHVRCV